MNNNKQSPSVYLQRCALDKMLFNLLTAGQVSESRLKEIQDEMSKEQQRVDGLTNKYVAQMREKNVSTCTDK